MQFLRKLFEVVFPKYDLPRHRVGLLVERAWGVTAIAVFTVAVLYAVLSAFTSMASASDKPSTNVRTTAERTPPSNHVCVRKARHTHSGNRQCRIYRGNGVYVNERAWQAAKRANELRSRRKCVRIRNPVHKSRLMPLHGMCKLRTHHQLRPHHHPNRRTTCTQKATRCPFDRNKPNGTGT